MDSEWMPQIDRTRCNGCGACMNACPTGALGWWEGKSALRYPEACVYCAMCEDICPVNAIALPYLIVRRPSNSQPDPNAPEKSL